MKKTKTLQLIAISLLLIMASSNGCKKFDLDTNKLTLSADLSIFRTIINFSYKDAKTGENLTIPAGTKLNVEVVSPTEGLVVNTASGEFQTSFSSDYAICSFSLNPYSTIPTPEKPITLLVRARLKNYLESVSTITVSEERNYNETVRLLSEEAPPDGVLIEKYEDVTKTDSKGDIKDTVSVSSDGGKVNVQIDPGTILKDEKGQPLTGNISMEITSIDVSTPEGAANVPELNQPMVTEEGKTSALFSPLAYTRVDITDDAGRKASSVTGQDIVIRTAVSPNIINPATAKPIAAGDLVPSYYFSRTNGNWNFFGKDTVTMQDGQPFLIKTIRSTKSGGGESDFSIITYSFDQSTPLSIQLLIGLPAERPTLPTAFSAVVKGISQEGVATVLFSNEITLFTVNTTFTINNISADYPSYSVQLTGAEMTDPNGVTQQKTSSQLEADENQFHFGFTADEFREPVAGDGPTRLYLQFSCIPSYGNPLFMDSPNLPNSFYLIFSGSGFTGETILQIQGGSFIVPFNPMLKSGGSWRAKVVMGSMEYPKGSGRVTVTNADFFIEDGKVIFKYTPETAEGCDDFKKALGID